MSDSDFAPAVGMLLLLTTEVFIIKNSPPLLSALRVSCVLITWLLLVTRICFGIFHLFIMTVVSSWLWLSVCSIWYKGAGSMINILNICWTDVMHMVIVNKTIVEHAAHPFWWPLPSHRATTNSSIPIWRSQTLHSQQKSGKLQSEQPQTQKEQFLQFSAA